MSSVNVTVECSSCKGVRMEDFDTKTLEKHCFCTSCGYSFSRIIKRDVNGMFHIDDNGKPLYETETLVGFGTYEIGYHGGSVHMGSFHKPITGKIVESFFKAIYSNPRVDEFNCRLTRFENGELRSIYGQLPIDYQTAKARLEKLENPFEDSSMDSQTVVATLIKNRKKEYKPSARVVLPNQLVDPYTPLPKGLEGTVVSVDDIGTVHVHWDNGSCLGITIEDNLSLANAE